MWDTFSVVRTLSALNQKIDVLLRRKWKQQLFQAPLAHPATASVRAYASLSHLSPGATAKSHFWLCKSKVWKKTNSQSSGGECKCALICGHLLTAHSIKVTQNDKETVGRSSLKWLPTATSSRSDSENNNNVVTMATKWESPDPPTHFLTKSVTWHYVGSGVNRWE